MQTPEAIINEVIDALGRFASTRNEKEDMAYLYGIKMQLEGALNLLLEERAREKDEQLTKLQQVASVLLAGVLSCPREFDTVDYHPDGSNKIEQRVMVAVTHGRTLLELTKGARVK